MDTKHKDAAMSRWLAAALLGAALGVGGCASTPANPDDPLEGYNRAVFRFNDRVDRAVLKPAAKTYDEFTPLPVRAGIGNFFGNLEDIWTGVNNLMQGKGADGLSDFARVVINSTLGILGVFDIATEMGLEKHDEDLGQTLGAWGVGEGPYFVLPIFGPSTVRDAAAKPVDLVVNGGWIQGTMAQEASVAGVKLVHTRANLLAADRVLDEGALDRYTYVREAFLQRRRYEVFDGRPPRRDDDYYSALTPGLVAEASTVEALSLATGAGRVAGASVTPAGQ
ncbi:MAG: VacJ family lipoprotein [Rhodocyclaceae bacterium]|nr:VacJ family lipoprotein [Rhodocyclaceae bacterium]